MITSIPFPLQIYAISITIRIVVSFLYMKNIFRMNLITNLLLIFSFFFFFSFQLGFMLLNSFWKFDFPPFMVLVIAILNDGNINFFLVS